MLTADTLKRVMLDALAAGQDYDGFRTALRQKLKKLEGAQADLDQRAAEARAEMQHIPMRQMVDGVEKANLKKRAADILGRQLRDDESVMIDDFGVAGFRAISRP
jgi:uncharacterized protein YhaN